MVDLSTTLRHYKREEIQDALISHSKNKEIAVKYGLKGFGKRPDTLTYPRDILEFAKQGASSFHCSEELWKNPLQLNPALKHTDLDELRAGWDLVLDIDCPFLDYSGIAADLLVRALKYHGVESVSVKFSGNHGFHIAVPFEAFPEKVNDIPTKNLFPDGPKKIALYLKEMIRDHLSESILKREDLNAVLQKTGKKFDDVIKDGKFDPFVILSIDTVLISSRHLYRMPYSLNEKSGLVSIPIDSSKILEFSKETAHPDKVRVSNISFLDRS
jgi:DNA primase catalytic subunit